MEVSCCGSSSFFHLWVMTGGFRAGKETLAERDKCVLYSFYQHSGETVMVKILFVCHGNI